MPMLNGTLTLHGVDAEKLATAVANDWCRQQRAKGSILVDSRKEDLIAYLVGEAWRISIAYDPAKSPRFYNYASSLLALRCTDWLRKDEVRTKWQFSGHTYERPKPELVSYDQATANGDPLGTLHTNPESDHGPDSGPAVAGLEDHGDRTLDRDLDLIRTAATQRAA